MGGGVERDSERKAKEKAKCLAMQNWVFSTPAMSIKEILHSQMSPL